MPDPCTDKNQNPEFWRCRTPNRKDPNNLNIAWRGQQGGFKDGWQQDWKTLVHDIKEYWRTRAKHVNVRLKRATTTAAPNTNTTANISLRFKSSRKPEEGDAETTAGIRHVSKHITGNSSQVNSRNTQHNVRKDSRMTRLRLHQNASLRVHTTNVPIPIVHSSRDFAMYRAIVEQTSSLVSSGKRQTSFSRDEIALYLRLPACGK